MGQEWTQNGPQLPLDTIPIHSALADFTADDNANLGWLSDRSPGLLPSKQG